MSGVGGVGWVYSVHEFAALGHGSMKGGGFHDYLSTSHLFKRNIAMASVHVECCLILSPVLCCSGFPK